MTEQVLVEAQRDRVATEADPGAAFEELRRALARMQSDRTALEEDAGVARALRSVVSRFRALKEKGVLIGVGLSPFIEDLLDRVDVEQAVV